MGGRAVATPLEWGQNDVTSIDECYDRSAVGLRLGSTAQVVIETVTIVYIRFDVVACGLTSVRCVLRRRGLVAQSMAKRSQY